MQRARPDRCAAAARRIVFLSPDQLREQGIFQGLTPAKRGRKAKHRNLLDTRVAELERENQRLQHRLKQAQIIIEAQKKISEILGIEQNLQNIEESK